jgi:2-hydroxychromene-2-carboxylate isomerase
MLIPVMSCIRHFGLLMVAQLAACAAVPDKLAKTRIRAAHRKLLIITFPHNIPRIGLHDAALSAAAIASRPVQYENRPAKRQSDCAIAAKRSARSMPRQIEFWFDFSSPYAYFAALEIDALARRHQSALAWRPFLLGAAFAVSGMQPLIQMPMRGDYAKRDWARLARRAAIPFTLPPSFPAGTKVAARAFYWLEAEHPALAPDFACAAFRAYFSEGRDIHAPGQEVEAVTGLAAGLGIDAEALRAALSGEALKTVLRARTDEALRRGIFGSPFIIADGEPFWGADRLAMVDEWLRCGGW